MGEKISETLSLLGLRTVRRAAGRARIFHKGRAVCYQGWTASKATVPRDEAGLMACRFNLYQPHEMYDSRLKGE